MPPRGGNPRRPAPPPAPIVSAHGNVGASQPHGTAKLAPAPAGLLGGVAHAIGNVGTSSQQAASSASTQHTSGRPGGDVQSGGYSNFAQANQYKNTPAYKQAIVAVFRAQNAAQKAAIIAGASRRSSLEGNVILNHVRSVLHSDPFSSELKGLIHPGSGGHGFLDNLLATGENFLTNQIAGMTGGKGLTIVGPNGRVSMMGPGDMATLPIRAGIDMGRATLQDPSVLPKTVAGLGKIAAGSAAALVDLPIQAVQQGPGKAISNLAKGIGKDYSQRYGPLIAGHDQAFIDRIKQQGAGPELLDALGLAGGVDFTAGRAITKLAHTREALSGAEAGSHFLTRARPALRVSGNEARAQALAPGAMKITAQRLEDALRKRKGSHIKLRPNEVSPLLAGRAQRVLVSGVASKWRGRMQAVLNREVRHGAMHDYMRLSRAERKAMPHVIEGHVPLRSGDAVATKWLERRAAIIRADRARGEKSLGNRIPPQHADKVDELAQIEHLQKTVKDWRTPRLAAFVDKEASRSARLEQLDLRQHPASAEARRLRPQGEVLGIEHPDVTTTKRLRVLSRRESKLATVIRRPGTVGELHAARAAIKRVQNQKAKLGDAEARHAALRDYSERVRQAARKEGMPEPAYLKHQAHPKVDFSAYTSGGGHAAMPQSKQSRFVLWHAGVTDRSPSAYFDSLAKSIKGAHQWQYVTEQFHRNALPTPTRDAIRSALGRDKHPADLTGYELHQVLDHMGVDMRHVKFYNPGRLGEQVLQEHDLLKGSRTKGAQEPMFTGSRGGGEPSEFTASQDFHEALNQNDTVQDGKTLAAGKRPSEAFLTTRGWKAVPRHAFDEIHANLRPSGAAGRVVGRTQGLAASYILGTSPSFLVMNTLAHALLATFGTRGRILTDAVKYPLWWHGLTPEMRNEVRAHAGGRAPHIEKLGSTARSDLAASWRELKQHRIMHMVASANPMRLLFKAEDMQSNFFRSMVYYSQVKRQALNDMAQNMSHAASGMNRISHAFTLGPKEAMAGQIRNMASAEEAGRYVVNMMGDYARFTSRERQWLNNRGVLFYSFLRHATRTLLYVLPFKHPIATAIAGELAKLHNDEVKKLLGGVDLPWAYSRVFFDKNGKLSSIDLMRSSPVGGAAVDVGTEGISGLSHLIAPEALPLLDMIYGQTAQGEKAPKNVFTALNDVLSLGYPYRLAKDLHFGTKAQQLDSIPFLHERPEQFKSAAAQQYQADKEAASGPLSQKILAGATGLVPKPDNSRVVAQHRAQNAGKGGGSGSWDPLGLSGGGAGGGGAPAASAPSGGWDPLRLAGR